MMMMIILGACLMMWEIVAPIHCSSVFLHFGATTNSVASWVLHLHRYFLNTTLSFGKREFAFIYVFVFFASNSYC